MHSLTLLEKNILFQTNQTESWQYPLIQNQETLTLESSRSMKERGLWLRKSQKSGRGGGGNSFCGSHFYDISSAYS